MGKYNASIIINRSSQEVFTFLNDQRNHATLNPHNFREFQVTSPQPVGRGAKARFILKTGSFTEPVQLQVTTSQPPTLLIEEGRLKQGGFRAIWQLSAVAPNQTKVELTTEYQTGGITALFGGVIQKAFERIYGRLLLDLQQKLDQPQPKL